MFLEIDYYLSIRHLIPNFGPSSIPTRSVMGRMTALTRAKTAEPKQVPK